MTAAAWVKKITAQMRLKGIESEGFETTILTLADMLEERDKIYTQYKKEGAHPLIEHTSDRGATNRIANPLLKEWQTMNRDALVYWRELGLTPKGLKALNEQAVAQNKAPDLSDILHELTIEQ